MRTLSVYWLIWGLLILIVANVIGAFVLKGLRDDVRTSAVSAYVGCKRANVQRDAVRFLLDARVHDSDLIAATSTNKEIAAYFKGQSNDARTKLEALLASAALTFADKNDPFLVDCERSYPLP